MRGATSETNQGQRGGTGREKLILLGVIFIFSLPACPKWFLDVPMVVLWHTVDTVVRLKRWKRSVLKINIFLLLQVSRANKHTLYPRRF